jgi:hypothetical protein
MEYPIFIGPGNNDPTFWGRMRIVPWWSSWNGEKYNEIILDRSTRMKHLPKFPIIKYITFCCVMNHLSELPDDVIKYILYIIIGVDRIDFRLRITEFMLSYFNIESLNIQIPSSFVGNMSYEAIHEATILKIFHIALMNDTDKPFKEQYWGDGVTIDYLDNVSQTRISENSEYQCACCKDYSCKLYNHVAICGECIYRLGTSARVITKHFSDILEFPRHDFIWWMEHCNFVPEVGFAEFYNLIPSTYYNYLEYDFSQKKLISDEFPIKELTFVSKEVQNERLKEESDIRDRYEREIVEMYRIYKEYEKYLSQISKKLNNTTQQYIVCSFINMREYINAYAEYKNDKYNKYNDGIYCYNTWWNTRIHTQQTLRVVRKENKKWSLTINKICELNENIGNFNELRENKKKEYIDKRDTNKQYNKFNKKICNNKYKVNIQKCGGRIMQPRCRGKY